VKSYRIKDGGQLLIEDVPQVAPGPDDVAIKIKAASVNYRDLLVIGDPAAVGRVPLSDGAGEIVAIGKNVGRWRVGDRVAAQFFRDWRNGRFKSAYRPSALGGSVTDGVLAEQLVLPAESIVRVPGYLSLEEAATLPCAAVTAWAGLVERGGLAPHDTLLVQGTGGVALFALQIAKAIGARVIVTSSSDAKLARARELGADFAINYRTTPEWDVAARELTNGEGASHVLELGGPDTYQRSLAAVGDAGKIVQVGVLTGFGPKPDLLGLQVKNADIIGVSVGSGAHFEAHSVLFWLSTRSSR
jgi:NADPH:quinone reductase-like Zn-dependent oxidoreductase